MFKILSGLMVIAALLLVPGCSSTLENVNEGAGEVGKTGGQVIRVPLSVSEGASEGIAGEPKSNPYNR